MKPGAHHYSKTNLVEVLILTNYFSIRDGKMTTPSVV